MASLQYSLKMKMFEYDFKRRIILEINFTINVIGDKRNNIIFILVFPNPTNPTEDTTFYHRDDSGMTTVEVDTLSVSSYHNNG